MIIGRLDRVSGLASARTNCLMACEVELPRQCHSGAPDEGPVFASRRRSRRSLGALVTSTGQSNFQPTHEHAITQRTLRPFGNDAEVSPPRLTRVNFNSGNHAGVFAGRYWPCSAAARRSTCAPNRPRAALMTPCAAMTTSGVEESFRIQGDRNHQGPSADGSSS